MEKRSPELLTKFSRPFAATTCKGLPVAGLCKRATVCGRLAQGRCLPGLQRASTARTSAPRRQHQPTAVSKGTIWGTSVPLNRRKDQYPAQSAKTKVKKAAPSPVFERRNSRFHIQTSAAANQEMRSRGMAADGAAGMCSGGEMRILKATAANGNGSVERSPGRRGLMRRWKVKGRTPRTEASSIKPR